MYTKKDFQDFLEKEMSDDQCLVFTNELTGTLSISKKGMRVTHLYASSCFERQDIGHIHYGNTSALGLMIIEKSLLSEGAKKLIEPENQPITNGK